MKAVLAAMALTVVCACTTASPAVRGRGSSQIAHFNHFFATVDPETAAAISNSAFLRRFANFEVRTTTGTRATWTGRYLYGKQTYVEFFGPADFQIDGRPAPVGALGIAVSGDRPGHVAELRSRLEAAGHRAMVEPQTRQFGERRVPWFTALTSVSAHGDSGGPADLVSIWAMEYDPTYFELPEAAKEAAQGPHDTISRERYQSDLYLERMMQDVTRVEFDVAPGDLSRIEPLLNAAGFRMRRSGDQVLFDGEETDLLFTLVPRDRMGLRRIAFSLNGPAAPHVEIIGRSRLSVGPDATAHWVFE